MLASAPELYPTGSCLATALGPVALGLTLGVALDVGFVTVFVSQTLLIRFLFQSGCLGSFGGTESRDTIGIPRPLTGFEPATYAISGIALPLSYRGIVERRSEWRPQHEASSFCGGCCSCLKSNQRSGS